MSVLAEKLVLWFQVNFDPPLNDRGVLKVEDWAEICRLRRAEGIGDPGDRPEAGDLAERGEEGCDQP